MDLSPVEKHYIVGDFVIKTTQKDYQLRESVWKEMTERASRTPSNASAAQLSLERVYKSHKNSHGKFHLELVTSSSDVTIKQLVTSDDYCLLAYNELILPDMIEIEPGLNTDVVHSIGWFNKLDELSAGYNNIVTVNQGRIYVEGSIYLFGNVEAYPNRSDGPTFLQVPGLPDGSFVTAKSKCHEILAVDSKGVLYEFGSLPRFDSHTITVGDVQIPYRKHELRDGGQKQYRACHVWPGSGTNFVTDNRDGLWGFGLNQYGLVDPQAVYDDQAMDEIFMVLKPTIIPSMIGKRVVQVASDVNFAIFLTTEGLPYTIGDNSNGALGNGSLVSFAMAKPIPFFVVLRDILMKENAPLDDQVRGVHVRTHNGSVGCQTTGGMLYVWGNNLGSKLADSDNYITLPHRVVLPHPTNSVTDFGFTNERLVVIASEKKKADPSVFSEYEVRARKQVLQTPLDLNGVLLSRMTRSLLTSIPNYIPSNGDIANWRCLTCAHMNQAERCGRCSLPRLLIKDAPVHFRIHPDALERLPKELQAPTVRSELCGKSLDAATHIVTAVKNMLGPKPRKVKNKAELELEFKPPQLKYN